MSKYTSCFVSTFDFAIHRSVFLSGHFIVAAYAVASESSGNDYEGVSQDDKGCKSQTLNYLNESYVGCLWALAIAKVTDTDSESNTDSV